MRKKIARLGLCWLGAAAVAPLLAAACAGTPLSLGDTAGAGGKASAAGTSTSGGTTSGGTMSGGGNSGGAAGGSQETCDKSACGPQLGLPNQICADGSMGGPTGRCLKNANGSCGWEIRQCPPDGTGSGGDASSGGTGTGGAPGGACGGQTCTVDQICCGPAECGHCISKLSGAACPNFCPGGDGGAGGTADCGQLLADVTTTQAAAQACNPASAKPTPECAGSLEGLCCPIGVESASATAPANLAYLNALKAYNASCAHACPEIACFEPKVGDCKAISAASGKCGP
jgi:hypothetical protein